MTKQEEIRESFERATAEYAFNKPYEELSTYERNSVKNWVRLRLTTLNSQGVVIKVDRGLPSFYIPMSYGKLYKVSEYRNVLLKAGCGFFEPLIKEAAWLL